MESHCLSCAECRQTLAIVLRLSRFPLSKEEEQALGALYPVGLKAAITARWLSRSGRPGSGNDLWSLKITGANGFCGYNRKPPIEEAMRKFCIQFS